MLLDKLQPLGVHRIVAQHEHMIASLVRHQDKLHATLHSHKAEVDSMEDMLEALHKDGIQNAFEEMAEAVAGLTH